MRVRGAVARHLEPNDSKLDWPSSGLPPDDSRAQDRLVAFLDGLCSKAALEAYLRDIADRDRSRSRRSPNFSNSSVSTVPTPWPGPSTRPPLALSAPITSPTFSGSSGVHAANSHRFASASRPLQPPSCPPLDFAVSVLRCSSTPTPVPRNFRMPRDAAQIVDRPHH